MTTQGTTQQASLVFTANLSSPNTSTQPIFIDYAVQDGTNGSTAQHAVANVNYSFTNGILEILPGQSSATISVPIIGETNVNSTQNLTLNLFNPVHVNLAQTSVLGTITENPSLTPAITVSAGTGSNSTSGTGTVTFQINLSSPAGSSGVTFQYFTTDGTAVSGTDYTGVPSSSPQTVTIASGSSTATITISLPQAGSGQIGELDKTFTLNLLNPQNATLSGTTVTGTIHNTDFPTATISNASSVTVPATGSTQYTFTVNLSQASQQPITIHYALGGTAVLNTDYTTTSGSSSGTVTIAAGQTSGTVTVSIPNTANNGRTLTLTLSSPTEVTLNQTTASTTISTLPLLNITEVDGKNNGTSVTFNLQLSASPQQPVVITYSTSDGTAHSGVDYTGIGSTQLTISDTNVHTITIPVTSVATIENNLTFTLNVSATNANLASSTVTGTIDNVNFPTATLAASLAVTAKPSGTTPLTFTVTLSSASPQTITIPYTLGGTAVLNTDYTTTGGTNSGTITIPGGQGTTTATVTVNVLNNTTVGTNPTVTLTLGTPVDVTINGNNAATTTIDETQVVSVGNQSAQAPPAGSGTMTFTASLTHAVSTATIIDLTYGTGGDTAVSGTDYTPGPTTVTIPANSTSATFSVTLTSQSVFQLNKVFTVGLSLDGSDSGVALSSTSATGTITPGVAEPSLTITPGSASVNAPSSGSTPATYTFTVTLSAASGAATTFSYSTVDGTAKAGTQYTATSATNVTIPAGQTTFTISVPVLPETINEANSNFTVVLSNASNATISTGTATGTIDNQVARADRFGQLDAIHRRHHQRSVSHHAHLVLGKRPGDHPQLLDDRWPGSVGRTRCQGRHVAHQWHRLRNHQRSGNDPGRTAIGNDQRTSRRRDAVQRAQGLHVHRGIGHQLHTIWQHAHRRRSDQQLGCQTQLVDRRV